MSKISKLGRSGLLFSPFILAIVTLSCAQPGIYTIKDTYINDLNFKPINAQIKENVDVYAKDGWTNSGIFVKKNDTINLLAKGTWSGIVHLPFFIKAKKVVVIADACHAGGVGQSFDIARRANRNIEINPISLGLQNLSKIGDGVCVISASDDKQFSQESKDWGGGHGVFTYFLLNGLKGEADYNRDSSVTLGELIPYLSEQVRRATSNAQSPTVAGKFDPALSIGR